MSVVPVTALPRALLPKLKLVPNIALQADPRISYSAWIPDEHYPDHEDRVTKLPLLVAIHGTHRGQERHLNAWKNFANTQRCAIVAPLFPAMLQGPLDVDNYHYLGCPPLSKGMFADDIAKHLIEVKRLPRNGEDAGLRYDQVLLDILEEVSARWPAIETSRIFLTGFSGGGQFAHRFAYLHPDRLLALGVGAPGSATSLDYSKPWPHGTQDIQEIFGLRVDAALLGEVPILAVVGDEDNKGHGAHIREIIKGKLFGTEEDLKKSRIDRLQDLVENWRSSGLSAELSIVPGVGHTMEGVHAATERFMITHLNKWWAGSSLS